MMQGFTSGEKRSRIGWESPEHCPERKRLALNDRAAIENASLQDTVLRPLPPAGIPPADENGEKVCLCFVSLDRLFVVWKPGNGRDGNRNAVIKAATPAGQISLLM